MRDKTLEIMQSHLRRLIAVLFTFALLAIFALLSGCASSDLFANRMLCTLDNSRAVLVSQWGGFGLSSHLSDADSRLICPTVNGAKPVQVPPPVSGTVPPRLVVYPPGAPAASAAGR